MRRVFFQILFWVIFFFAWQQLVYFYVNNIVNRLLFTAFDVGLILVCFYILFQWITPRYFFGRNKWVFLSLVVLTVLAAGELLSVIMIGFLRHKIVPIHFDFSWNYQDMVWNRYLIALVGAAAGFITQLAAEWLKTRKKMAQSEREKIAAELNYLKAQVNPHFLFNAFNTIYVQMDESPESAKESLAIFSDMLRYQLYDCGAEWVAVDKELSYLQHYIQLQKLRKDERYQIDFSFPEADSGDKIAPFLLIPFVENMFKHVSGHNDRSNIIRGDFRCDQGKLIFQGMNTFTREHTLPGKGGIGLVNVKRRLELLYPRKHKLIISNNDSTYEVWLEIQLH
jgi:two-component system, LytTR family, sensor kinase